jgi:eukaryotic-like serine/threonine-protein kinase
MPGYQPSMMLGMDRDEGLPIGVGTAGPAPVLDRRYVLEQCVGAGAFGQVHRAYDRLTATTVAVKLSVHRPQDEADPGAASRDSERQSAEIQTLSRLSHPGLVALLGAGTNGDRYCVMEFVDGASLDLRLRQGPLDHGQVAELGTGLAETLAYVHSQGVVHRDVKPSNILLPATGRARLSDFGVARSIETVSGLTATGCVVGTPRYMAPEQVRGDCATPACDIYALGLVLLECLTGHPEYPGTAIESAVARLFRAPRTPDGTPAWLAAAIEAMTATHPDDRPTATEAVSMLDGSAGATAWWLPAARSRVGSQRPVGSGQHATTSRVGRATSRIRTRRVAALSAAAAALLVGTGVTFATVGLGRTGAGHSAQSLQFGGPAAVPGGAMTAGAGSPTAAPSTASSAARPAPAASTGRAAPVTMAAPTGTGSAVRSVGRAQHATADDRAGQGDQHDRRTGQGKEHGADGHGHGKD